MSLNISLHSPPGIVVRKEHFLEVQVSLSCVPFLDEIVLLLLQKTSHDKSTTTTLLVTVCLSFRLGAELALLPLLSFLYFVSCQKIAMNAGPRGYDDRYPAAAAAAAARQVSPPNHGAPTVRTVAGKRFYYDRSLSPPLLEGPAPKKAKSYESIKKEVQDLLEKNLMGSANDDVKVETMQTLRAHFKTAADEESLNERQEKAEYIRAVTEWNGCHLVLVVLRQELDDAISRNRDVVFGALQFLLMWNRISDRREAMSRLNGVEAVLRALRAFRNDVYIQSMAVACLYNFTCDNDVERRRELVEGAAIPDIFRALMAPACTLRMPKIAIILLGRLCDVAEPRSLNGLVERGALEVVAKVVKAHKNSNVPDRQEVLSACHKLMTKLIF
jgi:hypothetical protein